MASSCTPDKRHRAALGIPVAAVISALTPSLALAEQYRVEVQYRDGTSQQLVIECPKDPSEGSGSWIRANCRASAQKDHDKWCQVSVVVVSGHKAGSGSQALPSC
jgi:hypothetical protein